MSDIPLVQQAINDGSNNQTSLPSVSEPPTIAQLSSPPPAATATTVAGVPVQQTDNNNSAIEASIAAVTSSLAPTAVPSTEAGMIPVPTTIPVPVQPTAPVIDPATERRFVLFRQHSLL